MFRRSVRLAIAGACVLGLAATARAQGVEVRLLEERAGGAVFEVTAAWPLPLRAALDSAGVTTLNERAALAAVRGMLAASETLRLPALAPPVARVLAADFDEMALPRAADAADVVAELDRPAAEVVGLGVERKHPAATLLARLLTYDAARGTLRRYRRLVVEVAYAAGPRGAARTLGASSDNPHLAVTRSVLADGVVYKIAITQEGVYRIDRDFLARLPGLELAPDAIDPNHVKVYGNGGAPVPALNRDPRLPDLAENPVYARGGGDGSFGATDAVFFYAAGPTGWRPVIERDGQGNVSGRWEHYVHPFSNENFYFIKLDGPPGARLDPQPYPGFADAAVLTQNEGRFFLDLDEFMWARERGGTGHTWVSNLLALGGGTLPLLQNTALPGLEAGPVTYRVRPAIQSNPAASVTFTSGGGQLASANFGLLGNSAENPVALSREVTFEQTVGAGAPLNLSMTLENQVGSPKAAVDWVRVFYRQALRAADGYLRFHTPIAQTGRFEMVLSGFAQEPQVWDVTEPDAIRRLGVLAAGGVYRVQVEVADEARPRELVAFTEGAVRQLDLEQACPGEGGCRVPAQNLHGIQGFPEFVIVTPEIFRPYADELADMRRQEGLAVEIVDVGQIYNEFSGGLLDPRAVRDYFRFLYDRGPGNEPALRYALLFGDGHFNYRNLGQAPALENWILPFETAETFDPESSYTSDDYFGLLDEDEGRWPFVRGTWPSGPNQPINERVDLGIGRFTVQTTREARLVLDKIRRYESGETYGAWRARYLFIADDALTGLTGSQNDNDLHTQNTDVVAELVEQVAPEMDQRKVYGISYKREFLNGWRIPGAREDLLKAIREGVLLVNYSGHGGEEGLAQEELFTKEDSKTIQNRDRLPIFITATCSFGRWDLAAEQSGAEELLLNPEGGAVALLTTVRTVYTTGGITTLNVGLNYELNRQLFQREADGLPRRLGDVMRLTKNVRVGYEGNNRKFNLLGDPTMRLGMPAHKAVVQTVNDVPVAQQQAPLRALDRVTLAGEVQTPDGTLDVGFSGVVNLTIFDAQRRVPLPVQVWSNKPYYTVREDLIWRGKVNASNGLFSATFVVPKDISYTNQPGRISVYAAGQGVQAQGFTENVVVGGTSANPPNDAKGPDIELFLNDEAFVDGGVTTPRPRLLVKLFDESGINTVGAGVGHEMLLVVDGNEQQAVNIGDLYEAEENSFQRGRVTFDFEEDLSAGPHALSVRAWDVLNNSGSASLNFVVSDVSTLVLENVFNYPNPTTGRTRFVFEHNQPVGTPARVQIRVYTLSGQPILTIEQDEVLAGGPVQVRWDGLDDDLDRLAPGVYLYKVRVEVEGRDGERQVSERIEKLAVVR